MMTNGPAGLKRPVTTESSSSDSKRQKQDQTQLAPQLGSATPNEPTNHATHVTSSPTFQDMVNSPVLCIHCGSVAHEWFLCRANCIHCKSKTHTLTRKDRATDCAKVSLVLYGEWHTRYTEYYSRTRTTYFGPQNDAPAYRVLPEQLIIIARLRHARLYPQSAIATELAFIQQLTTPSVKTEDKNVKKDDGVRQQQTTHAAESKQEHQPPLTQRQQLRQNNVKNKQLARDVVRKREQDLTLSVIMSWKGSDRFPVEFGDIMLGKWVARVDDLRSDMDDDDNYAHCASGSACLKYRICIVIVVLETICWVAWLTSRGGRGDAELPESRRSSYARAIGKNTNLEKIAGCNLPRIELGIKLDKPDDTLIEIDSCYPISYDEKAFKKGSLLDVDQYRLHAAILKPKGFAGEFQAALDKSHSRVESSQMVRDFKRSTAGLPITKSFSTWRRDTPKEQPIQAQAAKVPTPEIDATKPKKVQAVPANQTATGAKREPLQTITGNRPEGAGAEEKARIASQLKNDVKMEKTGMVSQKSNIDSGVEAERKKKTNGTKLAKAFDDVL